MSGETFLVFYTLMLGLAVIASFVLATRLRPAGRDRAVTDPVELAYLSGGATRLVDAEVTRRLAAGELAMVGKREFATASATIGWSDLAKQERPRAAAIDKRLVQAGLVVDRARLATMRFWAVLPLAVLAGTGLVRIAVGIDRDRPVGVLVVAVVITLVVAGIRLAVDRRTEAGRVAVRRALAGHDRLRRAAPRDEAALAVALFGTAVLAGSEFEQLHRLRSAGGEAGSAEGGDGGCGGGGCGGCGGS